MQDPIKSKQIPVLATAQTGEGLDVLTSSLGGAQRSGDRAKHWV